jgi:hypothetical protein
MYGPGFMDNPKPKSLSKQSQEEAARICVANAVELTILARDMDREGATNLADALFRMAGQCRVDAIKHVALADAGE